MTSGNGDKSALPISINPGLFVNDSILDLSMEQAVNRMLSPPKEPPTSNKMSFRRVLPELIETLGSYAVRHRITRAKVTFNLADYGMAWVESVLGNQDIPYSMLSEDCANAGRLDLLELVSKNHFVCYGWAEYGSNGTSIVVPDGIKGRAGAVSDVIGVDSSVIVQVGLAWAWTRSEVNDSHGTVERSFVPVINRFRELVDCNREQVDMVRRMLNKWLGKDIRASLKQSGVVGMSDAVLRSDAVRPPDTVRSPDARTLF